MIWPHRWNALLLLLALAPVPALAQVTTALSATGQYEYNSNPFDLESGYTVPGLALSPSRGDTDYSYSGTFGVKDQWRQQALYGDATGTEIDYDKYTQLDHDEYKFDAGWNGKFGRVWDGNLEVLRDRAMVPFLDVFQSTLTLTTEQREQGGLGLQFLPSWRLEASGYTHTVTWPLPGEPNLGDDESQGQLALKYVGTAGLTSGLSDSYLTGHYTGATVPALNPAYRQWTESFVANYMSGRSNLISAVGYTNRASPGVNSTLNSISGVTGTINYTNQLTGKTSVQIILARAINSYITNSGSEIDNSATLTANWQATYQIGVVASYVWDYAELPGQGNNPIGSNRLDHVQTATLSVDYQALRWLAVKPYVRYQARISDLSGGNFNDSVIGADLTVQWQNR